MNRSFGQIITFYSYKGGTGRSMAMANVGYLLAKAEPYGGKRVLMIDWDLEAPGLERFFENGPERTLIDSERGLIDYLVAMQSHYRKYAPDGELPESMALDDRARDCFREGTAAYPLKDYLVNVGDMPNLSLMTAGFRRNDHTSPDKYWKQVRAFDWDYFYREYGSFFTHFRELLMTQFDVVLIDSRTGLTDIGGICTRVMPEKLVVVFVPNHQNIDGVVRLARKSVEYRTSSRDPRSLTVFPLAARIDASASTLRTVWWRGGTARGQKITGYQKVFERLFGTLYQLDDVSLGDYFDATQIPHDSDYAYGEAVAAAIDGTADKFGIGFACGQLAQRLVELSAPWESLEEARSPTGIWVSYRRADTGAVAGRLQESLVSRYGDERVFVGVSDILPGSDFTASLEKSLANAGVMLVLIGRDWQDRLQDPSDFVRLEIATALEQDMVVVPVFTDGGDMPGSDDLPEELRPLAYRNGLQLRAGAEWDTDLTRLIASIEQLIGPPDSVAPQQSRWSAFVDWLRHVFIDSDTSSPSA